MNIPYLTVGMPMRLISTLVGLGVVTAGAISYFLSWEISIIISAIAATIYFLLGFYVATKNEYVSQRSTSVNYTFGYALVLMVTHLGYLVLVPYILTNIVCATVWYILL